LLNNFIEQQDKIKNIYSTKIKRVIKYSIKRPLFNRITRVYKCKEF